MDMTRTLRRFPMTFAPLALLVGPLGCGSDSPSTPVAEAPAVPTTVDGAATARPAVANTLPTPVDPATFPPMKPLPEPPAPFGQVDRDVQRTAGAVKDEARDAKGGVEKAVQDAKDEADRRAKALGNDARKAAEDALDNLLGSPK